MQSNKGFIKAIVLILIGLAVLKYAFHIELKDILNSQVVQSIWSIIKTIFNLIWNILLIALDFIKTILSSAKSFLEGLNK